MSKKRISFLVILIYIFTVIIYCPITVHAESVNGYETVAENNKYSMSYNPKDLNICITDKASGRNYMTFPTDWQNDKLSSATLKNAIASHIVIIAYDKENKAQTFNSYTLSVKTKTYVLKKTGKGLSIQYNFKPQGIHLTVNFELTDDGMSVTVPNSSITDKGEYKINTIEVLPFFEAAKHNDDGYLFIPDGSGALMEFGKSHPSVIEYSKPIYGWDKATPVYEMPSVEESIRMPVYGIKKNDNAFLSIVESGDASCKINAGSDVFKYGYYRVYPAFIYRDINLIDLTSSNNDNTTNNTSGQSLVTKVSPMTMKCDLKLKYIFLDKDKSNYSGMAESYRNYLLNTKKIKPTASKDPALDLTLIGGVVKNNLILGLPMQTLTTLTTFKQSQEIVNELKNKGVNNINLKLVGYNTGGYKSYWTKKVGPLWRLGGKSGLKDLLSYTKKNGVNLYLDGDVMFIKKSGKGFSTSRSAARFLSNSVAYQWRYNKVDKSRLENSYASYILSPVKITSAINSFVNSALKLNIKNVSINSIDDILYSDYSRSRRTYRDKSSDIDSSVLKSVKSKVSNLMVNGGNAYALPYVSNITDIPLETSEQPLLDEEVPFYSMAVHGIVNYSGEPVNTKENRQEYILRTIENGALPSFEGIYKESSALKESKINDVYGACYKDWIDAAAESYKDVDNLYKATNGSVMKEHKIIQSGVREVIYENGTAVIVNYTDKDVNLNGVDVKAKDFKVCKEGI